MCFTCELYEQTLSMRHVLSNCEDFLNEVRRLVMSPKGHCELAGSGIEYDWGKMKMWFQAAQPPQAPAVQPAHPAVHVACEALPLVTSRRFARKSRAYRRAFREGVDNELTFIESMVKTFKTHRNAIDFAFKSSPCRDTLARAHAPQTPQTPQTLDTVAGAFLCASVISPRLCDRRQQSR